MNDKWTKEIELFGLLQQLLQQADELRKGFVSAGLPLPGPLMRLLGNEERPINNELSSHKRYSFQTPIKRPEIAKEDWIAIKLDKLTAQDLVLAFLRDSASSLAPKELYKKIEKVKPGVQSGIVYNTGPRLISRNILGRNDDGEWLLSEPTAAPLIENEYAWGPPNIFSKRSLTANRRERILHILTESPDGLTTMQINKILRKEGVNISKDLTMNDMKVLHDQHLVRRSGKHKKWSVIHDTIKE